MNEKNKFIFIFIYNKNTNCKQSIFVLIKSSTRNLSLVFFTQLFKIGLCFWQTHMKLIFHRQQLLLLLVLKIQTHTDRRLKIAEVAALSGQLQDIPFQPTARMHPGLTQNASALMFNHLKHCWVLLLLK